MQNLEKREKILLGLTIAAVMFFIAWKFGLSGIIDSLGSGNSDVATQQKRFNDNLEELEDYYNIQRQFSFVGEFPSSVDGDLKPALAFTQQVSQICKDLGFEFPSLRPEVESIDGVDEYELINVALKTEGSWEDTVKLLKTFEQNGLIFRQLRLSGTRDRPIVVANMVVARIAEKPERPGGLGIRRSS